MHIFKKILFNFCLIFIGNKNIDLLNTVLNIAYINDVDLELFKIIIKCQKNYSNLNNYNFIKITKNELIPRLFGTDTQTSDLDIFVYFNTILNPLLDELVKQKNFTLISYDLSPSSQKVVCTV